MSDEKRKNQNYDQEMLKCAARAIASTKGVSRVKNKTVETILSGLLNKRFKSSGIRIKRQKGAIEFDVAVVLEYGVNIPIITWMIQICRRKRILSGVEIDYKQKQGKNNSDADYFPNPRAQNDR